MSRQEHEREDLLREATALVERVELTIPGQYEPIFIGFRKDGAASFYFGQDRVYHFNTAGQLRRAYLSGVLYKADQGKLVALQRERSATETILARHELSTEQSQTVLDEAQLLLSRLSAAITTAAIKVTGQVPADAAIVPRLQNWLAAHGAHLTIAARPNVA
jgi:hypothetical protein